MMTNNGIFHNLLSQFESVYKHNRQGSIGTKHRYRDKKYMNMKQYGCWFV